MKRIYLGLIASALLIGCGQTSEKEQSSSEKKLTVGVTMLSMQNEFIVKVSDEIDKKAQELATEFVKNFEKYSSGANEEILAAAPRIL